MPSETALNNLAAEVPGVTALLHLTTFGINGPRNVTGRRGYTEPPQDFHLPPGGPGRRGAVCAHDSFGAGPAGLSKAGERRRHRSSDGAVSRRQKEPGRLRGRHRIGPAGDSRGSGVRVSVRAHAGRRAAGVDLPDQRPGTGIPPLIFSVEQQSRRHADQPGQSRNAGGSCGARGAGAPDAG